MKTKKLQLITVSLFILTITLIIIGLTLIYFCNFHYINKYSKYDSGFATLKYFGIIYIIEHSPKYFYNLGTQHLKVNYDYWIQLKIGVIFCVILFPILVCITMSLIFLNIGLKIKIKNNNFWDAIQNCEIISNYYIH
ncbi:hypothetical protein [Spiroplasma ixodetis]|uniref:hypothetical protein n=1 Tax=Spiroplasma ixodetis TaxID=2141 RepID=UPI002577DDB2|nr:hypothetical protein [Spiroplasma ixodetis]WJG70753.1 hypothetical protein SIXOD_v1c19790 [Spiroplasma ixodetis Y32]